MVARHYLKYQHDLSDEDVVAAWVENPYWQHFSDMRHFQHQMPIGPSSMTCWRKRPVKAARAEGLTIKQSYRHVGRRLRMHSSRYAPTHQMKRAPACVDEASRELDRMWQ